MDEIMAKKGKVLAELMNMNAEDIYWWAEGTFTLVEDAEVEYALLTKEEMPEANYIQVAETNEYIVYTI